MKKAFDSICEILKAKDYKITSQRKTIIQEFLGKQAKHLSAEDVFNAVKKEHPEIGLATVYRTLDLLADLEIIHKIDFGDGRARYEIGVEENHLHHHLICLTCGQVTEFNDDLLENLEEIVRRQSGFNVVDHQVKFYGICAHCNTAK